jgi:F5/8 type C domain/Abnormal spindle-like microcephaly-assoc'd, ASPM-SPD-2-Hydin
MPLKERAAPESRGRRPRRSALVTALAVTAALVGGVQLAAPAAAQAAAPHAAPRATPHATPNATPAPPMWSTQLDFDNNGTAWSEASFAALKADGLTTAELNMPWNTIEPSPGTFSFTEIDQELSNAAAAGLHLVPIFWESGWGGSPASWATDLEVSSTGAQGPQPTWWDPTEQSEYFTYVTDTIQHIAGEAGYGGSILNYGFLDAQWDVNGGAGGWAADDVAEFQNTYLPQTYGTIATFNSKNGTSYTAFSQVPAADPGQPLAGVYQAFRAWSVQQTYGQLTADVRAVTASTPLYYYFGGHLANAPAYANNPDTFFQLAKTYNVTIIDDAAQSPGLTLTFGSLARAYGVPVAQEWTAPGDNSQLAAQAVQWLSNYAMGLPDGGGEDFFIHDGTQKDVTGFPIYLSWLSTLQGLSGSYPQQPAAVYIDYSQAYGNSAGGNLNNVEDAITNLWDNDQSGFAVVTSQEVANGAVSLSQFQAILPLNGVDSTLSSYQSGGGKLLTQEGQITQYAPAYAQLANVGVLQTVPSVASSHTSASITLADITSGTAYDAPISFSPAGLNLNAGTYHLVNAATGAAVPQTVQSSGTVCATANIAAASLAQWTMVSGAAPSGTPSASCPSSETGATSVTATPGQSGGGLQFLGVGQTNQGADGNLNLITQSGQAAVETWTTSQSGSGDANVYLQINPFTAVAAASTVTLQVTYWATSGQGFLVQYDAPGNAYLNGPTVTSPGTGTWTTASVQLTGAQFAEAQNMGADLRLQVTAPSQPLIVGSVTMSTAGSGGSATLAASPTSVSFGSETVGSTSAAQTVTISNTGSAAASVSSISAGAPFAETNTCGSSIAAGASCTASVTFKPTATGAASGSLTVNSNATNSTLTVALSGTGTSTATATLTASPTSVAFGSEAVGSTTGAQTVTISNTGSAAASVSSIAASAPFAETNTCGSSIAAGASCTASVTFKPTATGAASGSLTVNSNATNGTLTVALSGTGTSSGGGTTNLALNAPITASSYTQTYVPSNADDGNTSTYWEGTNGAWPTTISVNLGASDSLSSVVLDLPPSTSWGTRTQTLSILGSTNGSSYTTLVGSATYTFNPATGNTVTIALPSGTTDQYVELSFTANNVQNGAQLSEFQVMGTGTTHSDLALNAAVSASSYTQTYVPANAVDGNTSTYWEGTNGAWPTTLTVNLGSSQALGSVVLDLPPSTSWGTRTQTLSILGSTNGSSYTTLVGSATYTFNPATGNTVTVSLPSGTTDQYLELSFTANNVQNGAQLSELLVYGP